MLGATSYDRHYVINANQCLFLFHVSVTVEPFLTCSRTENERSNNVAVKVPKTEPKEVIEESSPNEFELEDGAFQVLEEKDERKLPPFPAKHIDANKDFLYWDWQNKLTDEDWNRVTCYLFREWPWIDRKRVDPKQYNNIGKYGSKWSKDDHEFLTTHGSGKYKVIISDNSRGKGNKGNQIGIARFEVSNPDYPPVFILEELVAEHPSNKGITAKLVAEGKLNLGGDIVDNSKGGSDNAALIGLLTQLINKQGQQQPNRDTTADNMAGIFKTTHETAMTMLKEQVNSDSPDKLVKMLAAMKEMLPKPESSNGTLELIVKMQTEMAKVSAEAQKSREDMVMKMMEMMNQKKDETDTFDMQLDRMIKMKEFMGENGGGGGKKNTLETVLEYGAPVAMKLMDTIMGFVNVKNAVDGLKRQQAQQAQQQQEPQGIPAPLPEPATEQKENVVEMPSQGLTLPFLLKNGLGAIILSAMERDVSGDEFADSIKIQHGKKEYDKIASLGKELILKEMQSVPEFWNQVVPSSIEKFVDEFIAYGSEEEGEEE